MNHSLHKCTRSLSNPYSYLDKWTYDATIQQPIADDASYLAGSLGLFNSLSMSKIALLTRQFLFLTPYI